MRRNLLSYGLVALTLSLQPDQTITQDSIEFPSITPQTIEKIKTDVLQGDYQKAVDVYLPKKEQQYQATLDDDSLPMHFLVRSLHLHQFLPDLEICGTVNTPSCEDLYVDPSCNCPKYDMNRSSYVLSHIVDIDISTKGMVYVTFDQDMRFVDMTSTGIRAEKNPFQVKILPKGASYQTRFELF